MLYNAIGQKRFFQLKVIGCPAQDIVLPISMGILLEVAMAWVLGVTRAMKTGLTEGAKIRAAQASWKTLTHQTLSYDDRKEFREWANSIEEDPTELEKLIELAKCRVDGTDDGKLVKALRTLGCVPVLTRVLASCVTSGFSPSSSIVHVQLQVHNCRWQLGPIFLRTITCTIKVASNHCCLPT